MPRCVVIDNVTNEIVNYIIADVNDVAPDGCRIELEPEVLVEVIEGLSDGN